jgi:hypothetical protein
MLIENLDNKVLSIKLISGEEIIAKTVEGSTDSAIIVSNPLMMIMITDDSDQASVAFVPWLLGLDDSSTVTIKSDKIIVYTNARQDAVIQYNSIIDNKPVVATEKHAPQVLTGAKKGGRGR